MTAKRGASPNIIGARMASPASSTSPRFRVRGLIALVLLYLFIAHALPRPGGDHAARLAHRRDLRLRHRRHGRRAAAGVGAGDHGPDGDDRQRYPMREALAASPSRRYGSSSWRC